MKRVNLIKKNEEDGMPTILEQSGAEPIRQHNEGDLVVDLRSKSNLNPTDTYRTKPAETVRNSDVHGMN